MPLFLGKLLNYLFNKRAELANLGANDLLLAKLVMDFHRKKTGNKFMNVLLYEIEPIHPIDRDDALRTTTDRAAAIAAHKEEIALGQLVSRELLGRFMPSISWIKVVNVGPERYVSFEGNGRLEALKRVFVPADGISVEVEIFSFRNMKKMKRRIDRVRRLNRIVQHQR